MALRPGNYILVSNYNLNCSRGGQRIQFREKAFIFKGLKCEYLKWNQNFPRHFNVRSFGRYGRFVLVITVVSFRSFRFSRFGCFVLVVTIVSFWSFRLFRLFRFGFFVPLFRVLVHAVINCAHFRKRSSRFAILFVSHTKAPFSIFKIWKEPATKTSLVGWSG